MVYKLLQRLNLRLCNIMQCIIYCYPSFLEQIRKMKRDNQRGTTVFHPETFDVKIEGDKWLAVLVNLQYALYALPNM